METVTHTHALHPPRQRLLTLDAPDWGTLNEAVANPNPSPDLNPDPNDRLFAAHTELSVTPAWFGPYDHRLKWMGER